MHWWWDDAQHIHAPEANKNHSKTIFNSMIMVVKNIVTFLNPFPCIRIIRRRLLKVLLINYLLPVAANKCNSINGQHWRQTHTTNIRRQLNNNELQLYVGCSRVDANLPHFNCCNIVTIIYIWESATPDLFFSFIHNIPLALCTVL